MKLFKYNQFVNESNESKESIDSICQKYGIKNYTINEDGTVDVNGSVNLYNKGLTSLPLKFGEVTGDFYCSSDQLISLEGCPNEVGGDFNCSINQLTSLEGCPSKVGGSFYFYKNKIKDVKGFPTIIGGNISIFDNPVEEVFKLFPRERRLEVPEFLNEYDVIRDGNKVVLQALELVYDELGLEVPDEIYIEGYEII